MIKAIGVCLWNIWRFCFVNKTLISHNQTKSATSLISLSLSDNQRREVSWNLSVAGQGWPPITKSIYLPLIYHFFGDYFCVKNKLINSIWRYWWSTKPAIQLDDSILISNFNFCVMNWKINFLNPLIN